MFGGETTNHDLTGAVVGATIGLAGAIADQGRQYGALVRQVEAEKDAEIARANVIIDDLTSKVRELLQKLSVEQCHTAGLEAYIDLVRSTSPEIASLSASGLVFADGTSKSNATLAYEHGFDQLALAKGLPGLINLRAR